MKKYHLLTWGSLCATALMALCAMTAVSCAEDGYDDDERFESTVTNSQLASPELTKDCFSTQVSSDGSERIKVTWKVVAGASGYQCNVNNVDDPANPVAILDSIVDGITVSFPMTEDTKYEVSVRTLGNAKLGNSDAAEASTYAYSTMIEAIVVPEGSDVAEYINANIQDTEDEQAFELKAGITYTCNSPIEFLDHKVTLRGDKVKHPIVVFGAEGRIYTSSQLKLKFIDFDCTEMATKWGVIEMSPEPPASKSAESQEIGAGKNSNKPADVFVLMDPIVVQNCGFKNVPSCFFSVGACSWGIQDLRILNSVIQMNNDGSRNSNGSFISAYSSEFKSPNGGSFYYGCIRNITIQESTVYNIAENSKCFTIRFNNKDIDRVFPTADGTFTAKDNTMIRMFDKKNFADRTPQQAKYVITMYNNIWLNCYLLQKLCHQNCSYDTDQSMNVVYAYSDFGTLDTTDKNKWGTEEDPGISQTEILKELDFTKENYGLDFTATGALSSTIGDPRWK